MQQTKTSTSTTINAVELKRLLVHISNAPSICFRCRQIGEMWMKHHCLVSSVNEKSVLLYDEVDSKYYLIRINSIMQFDVDNRFQNFQPHYHYDVQPSAELE